MCYTGKLCFSYTPAESIYAFQRDRFQVLPNAFAILHHRDILQSKWAFWHELIPATDDLIQKVLSLTVLHILDIYTQSSEVFIENLFYQSIDIRVRECFLASRVDHCSVLIQDIIILQDVLSGIEVPSLDLLLYGGDFFRQHRALIERLVIWDRCKEGRVEHTKELISSKNAHDIVLW